MNEVDKEDKDLYYGTLHPGYGAVPPKIFTLHPGYGAVPPKIFESPDKGKTIYEREFGSTERLLIKTAVQQQWNITYNGMKV